MRALLSDAVFSARYAQLASGGLQGVQAGAPIYLHAGPTEFLVDHSSIEAKIVSHNNGAMYAGGDVFGDVLKGRSVSKHRGGDTVYPGRSRIAQWVDQGVKFFDDSAGGIHCNDGDFDDPVAAI
ncbi:hypothetical protein A5645_22385 [Mycobacterium asiaticum]|nr:hypothetical protein A5645_22385 [Mycobacterium asiaticum]